MLLSLKLNFLILFLKLNPLVPSLNLNILIPSLKLNPLILSLKLILLILFLKLKSLTMRYLLRSLTTLCLALSVLRRKSRSNSCLNFSATRDSLLICFIEDQIMGGNTMTSTVDVMTRAQQSPCLRSKTETALAATPRLNGNLMSVLNFLVIAMRCCSTCLDKGTSQTKQSANRFPAVIKRDLLLERVIPES
jgi:hypothetical protein